MWKFLNPIRHAIPDTRWPSLAEASKSQLFRPIQVGPLTIENRTWVPAMVPWRATEDGFVTQANLDWYRRFAAGKPGVLVVEATGVRDIPSGPLLRIGHERFIPGLRDLVETVREASGGHTRLFIQIIDFLAVRRRPEKENYFTRFLILENRHRQRLVEALNDPRWRGAEDLEIRSFLASAADELQNQILNDRELEALRFGYRERVTDTYLPHIANLPIYMPEIFAAAAGRAREA